MGGARDIARRVLDKLRVKREEDNEGLENGYVNKDTRPLPPSRRTYGPWGFVGLWMVTGSFNIGGYSTGSSIVSLGLNVWQSMLAVIIGFCLVALVCVGTGMPGAEWHIGFPILQRSTWGKRGSVFPLVIRIILSFVWCSVQLWWGGECVKTLIGAIWPSFYNVNKSLAGGTMQANDFIGFILFALFCAPLIWFPPERYHKFFIVTSIAMIACTFGILIWALSMAHGAGALVKNTAQVTGVKQATGSDLGWAFVYAISSVLGSITVHLLNQSDYTRFARQPKDQILGQVLIVPLTTIFNALVGVLVTSAGAELYPDKGLLWLPYDLLAVAQAEANNSSKARVGVAFASIAFILAQIGIAVVENALSGGIDLAGLFPRWFTLRRGGYLTLLLGFVFQPWQTLNGASVFLTVMGSFSTFLSPMIAILIADYFMVRRRKLSLINLFMDTPRSMYWYQGGFNLRTIACWVLGVFPLTPGLVASVQERTMTGWSKMYNIGFLLGFAITFGLYVGSHYISPIHPAGLEDDVDVFGTFLAIDPATSPVSSSGSSQKEQVTAAKVQAKDTVIDV